MNKPAQNNAWINYLETPISTDGPVHINRILQKRMRTFMKARKRDKTKVSK